LKTIFFKGNRNYNRDSHTNFLHISVAAESDVRPLRCHLLSVVGETQAATGAREQQPLSTGPAAVGETVLVRTAAAVHGTLEPQQASVD